MGTFALPALLLRNIAELDFSSVNWIFLSSIFISKTTVFFLAIFFTLITLRPINIGLAAVFAIFVSQSNDFALGFPIVSAIYSETHPDYIHYIYLLAPISLCILNPIAFILLEINEKLYQQKKVQLKENDSDANEAVVVRHANDTENDDDETESDINHNLVSRKTVVLDPHETDSIQEEFPDIKTENQEISIEIDKPIRIKKRKLIKSIAWSTISNPIVFMVIIGIAANFILNQKLPDLIKPIINTLGDSFSALALFYLGFSMVGRIKNLTFSSVVIILILIFTKGLLFPLMTREIVLHLDGSRAYPANATAQQINVLKNETDSLSTFAFLYGTFPTAPALFFYITKYEAVQQDLVSAALVFGTLASAPLMMISGKMISIQYTNNSVSNFEDIQCKTAYGFSILSWFCCIWVLYIFLASGRLLKRPHLYTFFLIVAQMVTSIIHIIWSSLTNNLDNISKASSLTYVTFTLLFAYLTRCLPVTVMLNLMAQSGISRYNQSSFNRFIFKLSSNTYAILSIGVGLPVMATVISLLLPGIPDKQAMMISVGKPQQIISCTLLLFVIAFIGYLLVLFARAKSNLTKQKTTNGNYHRIDEYLDDALNDDNSEENAHLNGSNNRRHENGNRIRQFLREPSDETDALMDRDAHSHLQLMKHVSLIVILTFNCFICLFIQLWSLFEESKSGIFYELELLDTTLLFGQGFFAFVAFGLDGDFVFSPVLFKIKELLGIIKPFKLPPLDQVPLRTIEICKKFEQKYKLKCQIEIERNFRFHHKYYVNVFKASDLVEWLKRNRLAKNRKKAIEFGRILIEGRVIEHVSLKRDFHDGFQFYRFNQD